MKAKGALLALCLFLLGAPASHGTETCRATLRDAGGAGDGKTDDSPAIARALATGCAISGEGLSYRITRPIRLPDNASLSDATFVRAIPPGPVNRAIVAENVSNISLSRIRLDRGADPSFGLAPGADPYRIHLGGAGVYLSHVTDATLTDVEVFGDGVGTGIKLENVAHVRLLRPHVHDMRWASAVQPENEVMVGVWAEASRDVTLDSPRIANLTPAAILAQGGRADGRRNNMTDGIASSGVEDFFVVDADVSNVGEAFDFSGSLATRNFTILRARARDIDSWCYKATHADGGTIRDSLAHRCGLGGFVLAGRVRNVSLIDDEARDIGANGRWPASRRTGFSLELAYETVPTHITIRGCRSVDAQQTPSMTFGFFNEAAAGHSQRLDFSGNVAQGYADAACRNIPACAQGR